MSQKVIFYFFIDEPIWVMKDISFIKMASVSVELVLKEDIKKENALYIEYILSRLIIQFENKKPEEMESKLKHAS